MQYRSWLWKKFCLYLAEEWEQHNVNRDYRRYEYVGKRYDAHLHGVCWGSTKCVKRPIWDSKYPERIHDRLDRNLT